MDNSGNSSTTVIAGHQGITGIGMTPTTQPKLTDARVLAILEDYQDYPTSTRRECRTAVAGIIAERNALLLMLVQVSPLVENVIAYTGTEE